jgi:pimeloyl-ACP methyl ester carboxylesterase
MSIGIVQRAGVVLLMALAQGGVHAQPSSPRPGTLFGHPRYVATATGEVVTFESGVLYVPEGRRSDSGRVVSIPYYRLRSTASQPATPIFLLAGGPGDSWLQAFEAPEQRAEVLFYRQLADVVLLDQRGAGESGPLLECPQRLGMPLAKPGTDDTYAAALRKAAAECRSLWSGQGIDLAAYNTMENAADVDDLRRALGYSKISLVAGSYGTHLSFALMRHYSDVIERVMLYGLEGPDQTYDMPSGLLEDLARIASAAERSDVLAAQIPDGGLMRAFATVQARLEQAPVTVNVTSQGQQTTVAVGRSDVQMLAKLGAHARDNLFWPAHVIEMYNGDFSRTAEALLAARNMQIDSAMFYMMDCASSISPERRKRILTDPAERAAQEILGDPNIDYFQTCDIWDSPDAGDAFREDLIATTPALMFQGTWDISTPYANAPETARGLKNGKLVTVEGGTHATTRDLYQSWAPMRQLVSDFLRGKSVTPPKRVSLPDPKFIAPRTRAPQQPSP